MRHPTVTLMPAFFASVPTLLPNTQFAALSGASDRRDHFLPTPRFQSVGSADFRGAPLTEAQSKQGVSGPLPGPRTVPEHRRWPTRASSRRRGIIPPRGENVPVGPSTASSSGDRRRRTVRRVRVGHYRAGRKRDSIVFVVLPRSSGTHAIIPLDECVRWPNAINTTALGDGLLKALLSPLRIDDREGHQTVEAGGHRFGRASLHSAGRQISALEAEIDGIEGEIARGVATCLRFRYS